MIHSSRLKKRRSCGVRRTLEGKATRRSRRTPWRRQGKRLLRRMHGGRPSRRPGSELRQMRPERRLRSRRRSVPRGRMRPWASTGLKPRTRTTHRCRRHLALSMTFLSSCPSSWLPCVRPHQGGSRRFSCACVSWKMPWLLSAIPRMLSMRGARMPRRPSAWSMRRPSAGHARRLSRGHMRRPSRGHTRRPNARRARRLSGACTRLRGGHTRRPRPRNAKRPSKGRLRMPSTGHARSLSIVRIRRPSTRRVTRPSVGTLGRPSSRHVRRLKRALRRLLSGELSRNPKASFKNRYSMRQRK
mmetsp:Transcript_75770/g.245288  ORF Transcript_75770/g.245288 Transcript_75770/m.245288 type:complete len:300 (-) Transcript_75770:918-1817(-)